MQFPDPLRRTLLSCRAILWLASWLVPRGQRKEWRQQQLRQIWHWVNFLSETGQLNRENKLELARHCWGAFADAFWVRYDREEFLRRLERLRRAPETCLVVATLLVLAVVLAGGFIPAARSRLSSAISSPDRVCVVSLNGKFRRFRSETLLDLACRLEGQQAARFGRAVLLGSGKTRRRASNRPDTDGAGGSRFLRAAGRQCGCGPDISQRGRTELRELRCAQP